MAGYVNVTNLYDTREPSGLDDGRFAFETFARRYLQWLGVSNTIFALNGSAGPFNEVAYALLGNLTDRGVAFNMAGQRESDRAPTLRDGVPFLGQDYDLTSDDNDENMTRVLNFTDGPMPGFHVFRVVLAMPGFMSDLTKQLFVKTPERRISVVAPEVLFTLIGLQNGHAPKYRATFVSDNVPETASPHSVHALRVTVRNDGFDTWTTGSFRLGMHLASTPIAPRSLPSSTAGYPYRFGLPRDVWPGESVTIVGNLPLPVRSGHYHWQLDMVEEGVTWFETQKGLPWQSEIDIR